MRSHENSSSSIFFLNIFILNSKFHAQEHVALLKKSVSEWNQWRKQNPGVIPDLRGSDFIKAKLQGVNLQGATSEELSLQMPTYEGPFS